MTRDLAQRGRSAGDEAAGDSLVCAGGFEETLLSGWLDGELTQGDEQRVRVHLEDCRHCRQVLSQLTELRRATGGSTFRVPDDRQWDERPRGALSRVMRNFGWLLLLLWVLGASALGLWGIISSGGSIWALLPPLILCVGFGSLMLSVALDRLRALPTDRYRKIKK